MTDVRTFVEDAYKLISASSPTVPLHGSDLSLGIRTLNRLLRSYAGTGKLLTISKEKSLNISTGTKTITTGPSTVSPTPDIPDGKLVSIEDAWLILNGVTYPLINISRERFNSSWKFNPLQALPRFIIWEPNTETVDIRIYPAPSQQYEFFIRGKFQLETLDSNDDLSILPDYYDRFLSFALARDLAMYKGRTEAWTKVLEAMYQEAKIAMENVSPVNVAIEGDRDSMLNGSHRLKAGV